MNPTRLPALAALSLLGAATASAHIGYTNRHFGTFLATGLEAPVTLTGQTVSSAFGWADATDADFGDSHRTRAFRFTLANPGTVTLAVAGAPGLRPAFSLYAGLAHLAPALPDHDSAALSQQYLTGLGTGPKEGSLYALGPWAIGNDPVYLDPLQPQLGVAVPASLSHFTYHGHAADGTAANYGATPGIVGDGVADGFVTGTFALPAGDFSIFIGGADYAAQGEGPYPSYGITPTLTVVPEPAGALLLSLGALGLLGRRRRTLFVAASADGGSGKTRLHSAA